MTVKIVPTYGETLTIVGAASVERDGILVVAVDAALTARQQAWEASRLLTREQFDSARWEPACPTEQAVAV